ncbi:hypothetical protein SUGI_1059780 [Cryptomeria japonica]|uniref:anthocyanidin 5,3-O-glucosyltransferase n=1 Tax=Cryptomeria japonica TaxID=3369 RepID=UPI002414846B|nr:anthocyanidin 5,3-O-glucosyltransferase [Cryptomeria japonica]GLJ49870.1 hypothetical protein SUGI_1059780 [Cryptomeria japonica]
MQKMGTQKAHIAMFPSWGTGHLIPFMEFAKRMAADHSFTVTFITSSFMLSRPQISQLRCLASSGLDIRVLEFPSPEEDTEEEKTHSEGGHLFKMFQLVEKSKVPLQDLLRTLKDDICAFITDLFCTVMIEPSTALHIPAYVLLTTAASNLCLMLYHPTLHAQTTSSLCDMDRPVDIPGLPSMPTRYFPDPMQRRTEPIYHLFLRHSHRLCNADGILINTFHDLESGSIRALIDRKRELFPDEIEKGPEIYPVGPLIRASDSEPNESGSGCLEWLDRQPVASVIFVSFGSMGFLSAEQTRELALGLEASGERFLWVLRKPEAQPDSEILPAGFEERIRDRGVVWRSWAPQIRLLSHQSIGGFVCHCGWNSVLESVSCGVPLVAWPLGAEQWTSAFFLVKESGMAIEPQWAPGWSVSKEEVQRVARELIRGESGRAVRARAAELKESARKAWADGGRSTEVLSVLASQWKSNR